MGRLPAHSSRAVMEAPGAQRHHQQANNSKPGYKVVLEEVTQKKKILETNVWKSKEPPQGYTFVAAGNPQLTSTCKETSRLNGQLIYVVSTSKHIDTALSKEVHRVGYHFPSAVVDKACARLGIDLTHDGHELHQHLLWPDDSGKQMRRGPRATRAKGTLSIHTDQSGKKRSQEEIDLEARQALKDLFPAMPDKDLREIIFHAFDLKSTRVGSLYNELSLPRRVHLATVAHVRHCYTSYDRLLKELPYQTARRQIEQDTLAQMAAWRGDDDDDPEALEDILREVIVLSDDDDDNGDDDAMVVDKTADGRHSGLQFVSSRPVDKQTERPVHYEAVPYRGNSRDLEEMPEATSLGNGQFVFDQRRYERAGARLNNAWKEARGRVQREHEGREPRQVREQPSAMLVRDNQPLTGQTSNFENHQRASEYSRTELVPLDQGSNSRSYRIPESHGYNARPNGHEQTTSSRYEYELVPQRYELVPVGNSQWPHQRGSRPQDPLVITSSPAQETILPSIEPTTPTTKQPMDKRPTISEVIVINSPAENNKRKRYEEAYRLSQRPASGHGRHFDTIGESKSGYPSLTSQTLRGFEPSLNHQENTHYKPAALYEQVELGSSSRTHEKLPERNTAQSQHCYYIPQGSQPINMTTQIGGPNVHAHTAAQGIFYNDQRHSSQQDFADREAHAARSREVHAQGKQPLYTSNQQKSTGNYDAPQMRKPEFTSTAQTVQPYPQGFEHIHGMNLNDLDPIYAREYQRHQMMHPHLRPRDDQQVVPRNSHYADQNNFPETSSRESGQQRTPMSSNSRPGSRVKIVRGNDGRLYDESGREVIEILG